MGQSILEDLVFLIMCRGVRTRGAWAIFAHSGSWTRIKWNGNSETAVDPILHVTKHHCTFHMGTPLCMALRILQDGIRVALELLIIQYGSGPISYILSVFPSLLFYVSDYMYV